MAAKRQAQIQMMQRQREQLVNRLIQNIWVYFEFLGSKVPNNYSWGLCTDCDDCLVAVYGFSIVPKLLVVNAFNKHIHSKKSLQLCRFYYKPNPDNKKLNSKERQLSLNVGEAEIWFLSEIVGDDVSGPENGLDDDEANDHENS